VFIEFTALLTVLHTQRHISEYVTLQNKGSVLDLTAEVLYTVSAIIHSILNLSLGQDHILFQGDFSTECDLVIPLSTSNKMLPEEVFFLNTIHKRRNNVGVFRRVRRIAKGDNRLIMSVRPSHEIAWLPLEWFT
jgi:hypothetical protein